MPRSDEFRLIETFFRPLAGKGAFELVDDAGLIVPTDGVDLVVTSDTIACGVHYLPDDPPDTVARKALRANLSDLAAKGADPVTYVLNLAMGPEVDDDWLTAFTGGLRSDQDEFGLTMLGGDTISADQTVISVMAVGHVATGRMVHRFSGKPGDYLYVSGDVGAARAGLDLLTSAKSPFHRLSTEQKDNCIRRYQVPLPRTALAPVLQEFASAAMDVSDGLIGDADKLVAASGCTGSIDADLVPLADGLGGAAFRDLLPALITGGDDYEILASIPPEVAASFEGAALQRNIQVKRIGSLEVGTGPVQVIRSGRELRLPERAFIHRDR